MNAIESKLNYFKSKLDDIRRTEMDLKMKIGQFDEEYKMWLKEQGLPDPFTQIDLIAHFLKKRASNLVLP